MPDSPLFLGESESAPALGRVRAPRSSSLLEVGAGQLSVSYGRRNRPHGPGIRRTATCQIPSKYSSVEMGSVPMSPPSPMTLRSPRPALAISTSEVPSSPVRLSSHHPRTSFTGLMSVEGRCLANQLRYYLPLAHCTADISLRIEWRIRENASAVAPSTS